jgi:hypothetical protein
MHVDDEEVEGLDAVLEALERGLTGLDAGHLDADAAEEALERTQDRRLVVDRERMPAPHRLLDAWGLPHRETLRRRRRQSNPPVARPRARALVHELEWEFARRLLNPPADGSSVEAGGDAMRESNAASATVGDRLRPGEDTFDTRLEPEDFFPSGVLDGRYRLRRTIGHGGTCVVFDAEHLFTGQTVAIKTLLPEHRHSPSARERLLREAHALGLCRHENIVSIADAGMAPDGSPYLVLEKLEGRPLDGILELRGRLSVAEALHIVRHAALAVAEAHRHGFIHRDLKPANVVVMHGDPERPGERVRLIDFGIALPPPDEARPKLTAAGLMVGTPEYLAPEQILGAAASQASDVYALGLVLFECISGVLPFRGSYAQRLLQITSAPARSVKAIRPEVSDAVAALLHKALARDIASRYPTAEAFARAIDAIGEASTELALLRGVPPPLPSPLRAGRRSPRAAYVSPLRVAVGDRVFEGRVQDIAAGGMLCFVQSHIDVGATVTLRFSAPVEGRIVETQGLVRWARRADRAGRFAFAIGVEFSSVSAALAREIEIYVSRLAISDAPAPR